MNAYFDTNHVAGLLFMVIISAWGAMELSQRSNVHREGATRIGGAGDRIAILACLIATIPVANLTPRVVPAAAIRPAAVAFAAGLVVLLAGLLLLTLTPLLWRIHVEERALSMTLGDRYRAYAAQHKRLVPLVW